MTEQQVQRLERLLSALMRPTFIWQMASALALHSPANSPHNRGAIKRHHDSLCEIDRLIKEYCRGD